MISIITPVHKPVLPYLKECMASLERQTNQDFEWLILANGGVYYYEIYLLVSASPINVRIFEIDTDSGHGTIGALKGYLCDKAEGIAVIELDADDLLTEDAVDKVSNAFLDESTHFLYTNSARFNDVDWTIPQRYGHNWVRELGWKHRPFTYLGHELEEVCGFPPDHNTMRRIEWAPNHIRAWRMSSYSLVGGHDVDLKTGDDHDLVCRMYTVFGSNGFKHIDECLYLYRERGSANSCKSNVNDVQARVAFNYQQYYEPMALRTAMERGLKAIDLGGRFDSPLYGGGQLRYTTLDMYDADIIHNLESRLPDGTLAPYPFDDSSVGVLRAYHLLEHLGDTIHAMNEAYRILAPGGVFFIEVPSTDGRGAWQDPTHVSFFNENSFLYYTNESHAKYIRPQFKGRFMLSRVVNIQWDRGVVVTRAELICLKDGYEAPGEIYI